MVPYTPVGGTWDFGRGQWYLCTSVFAAYMRSLGRECLRREGSFWPGGLAGLLPGRKYAGWEFGAGVFGEWVEANIPDVTKRRILSVSHGGQPVMMAAARGLELHSHVSLMMPVREDLKESVYRPALQHIGRYTCVYTSSLWRNYMQAAGSLLDGHLGLQWCLELEGVEIESVELDHVGHTTLVRSAQHMPILAKKQADGESILDRL
jgi:hypothetical protein